METKYYVGCGLSAIYAGRLNKKGDMWVAKTDVTNAAIAAVAQYMVENNKAFDFELNGVKYTMCCDIKE